MNPLKIKQETAELRLFRLEKTLVTIYDALPFAIKLAIYNQKMANIADTQTVGELIQEMRQRVEFESENSGTSPGSHQQSD